MPESRRRFLAAVGASLAIAGCQNDGGGPTPTDTGAPAEASGATVAVTDHDEHGEVLVDGEGMTLYMFDSDTQDEGASTCSDSCLDAWPPLTTDGDPAVGDGVDAELTTFERDDGDAQVSANGWPLYYYASDQEPGDVTGQGVNEVWWVLDPSGAPVRASDASATSSPTPTESDDGGGIY